MSIANRVVKNTLFLYVRMAVSIVFSFFTTRILLQSLGESDYGLYNVVAGALSMLGFISGSLSSATQRFISYAEGNGEIQKIKKIFSNAVLIHRFIAVVAVFIFVISGFFFFNGILNIPSDRNIIAVLVYMCMIFSTVYSITIVPYEAIINAHENMLYYSILGIVDATLKLIIAILVYNSSFDHLLFYAIMMALESWMFRTFTVVYCKKHYREVNDLSIKENYNKDVIIQMSSYTGWNTLNIFSGMVCLYGISIIVNHYFGTTVNAALGVATQLSGVLMGLTQNMSKALTPVIVKSEGSGDRYKMRHLSLVGCRFSYLVFCFVCLPICFSLNSILLIWLKQVPHFTYEFCLIMLLSELIEQMYLILSHSISAEGNIKGYCICRSIVNLVSLPVIIFLFEMNCPPTISWMVRFVTYILLGGIITVYYSKKNIGLEIKEYTKKVIFPCIVYTIVSVCCFVTIRHFCEESIFVLFTMYALSLLLIWIAGLKKDERNMIMSYISSKCKKIKL